MFNKLFKKKPHSSEEKNSLESNVRVNNDNINHDNIFNSFEADSYEDIKIKSLIEKRNAVLRCIELILLWKRNPTSENILNEFIKKIDFVAESSYREDMPKLLEEAQKINGYVYESIQEDVLGDRVFFIGVSRQLTSVLNFVDAQLEKYDVADIQKESDSAAVPGSSELTNERQVDSLIHEENGLNSDLDSRSSEMSPVEFESIHIKATEEVALEKIEDSPVENSMSHVKKISSLIINQFGIDYAISNEKVSLILEAEDAEYYIKNNKVFLNYEGYKYTYTSLPHILFGSPILAPQGEQKLVLLQVKNEMLFICVDDVAGLEDVSIVEYENLSSSFFQAEGVYLDERKINILDVSSLLAQAKHAEKLSMQEISMFEISNKKNLTKTYFVLEPEKLSIKDDKVSKDTHYQNNASALQHGAVSFGSEEAVIEGGSEILSEITTEKETQRKTVQPTIEKPTVKEQVAIEPKQSFSKQPALNRLDVETFENRAPVINIEEPKPVIEPIDSLDVLFINTSEKSLTDFQKYLIELKASVGWSLSLIRGNLNSLDILTQQSVVILEPEEGRTVDMDILVKIRKDIRFRRLPVIVTTHLSSDIFKQRAYILGANYLLQMPYTHQQLQEVIKMVVTQVTVVEDIYEDDTCEADEDIY